MEGTDGWTDGTEHSYVPLQLSLTGIINNYNIVFKDLVSSLKGWIDVISDQAINRTQLLSPVNNVEGRYRNSQRPSFRPSVRPSENKVLSQPQFFTDPYRICTAYLYH